ncbi:hypothetical protein BJ508DRAFT_379434 [Ascobolus immersus RN42]|uniref:Uncharacterized protein n=1 Tax=Ascobolus immersus RN42 TaxID=1160509 RepID=A0A3N4I3U4_ASCIM|nr:hypothetical protein BJ508DRAFT_379434 [Ascobolus immersus RN42]
MSPALGRHSHVFVTVKDRENHGVVRTLAHVSYDSSEIPNFEDQLFTELDYFLLLLSAPTNRHAVQSEARRAIDYRPGYHAGTSLAEEGDGMTSYPFVEYALWMAMHGSAAGLKTVEREDLVWDFKMRQAEFYLERGYEHLVVAVELGGDRIGRSVLQWSVCLFKRYGPPVEVIVADEWRERLDLGMLNGVGPGFGNAASHGDSGEGNGLVPFEENRYPTPHPPRPKDGRTFKGSLFRSCIQQAIYKWVHEAEKGKYGDYEEVVARSCLHMIYFLENDAYPGCDRALLNPYVHQELAGLEASLRNQASAPFLLYIFYRQTCHVDNLVDFSPFLNISPSSFFDFLFFLVGSGDIVRHSIIAVDISNLREIVYAHTGEQAPLDIFTSLLTAFPNLRTVYLTHTGAMSYRTSTLPTHWTTLFPLLLNGASRITKILHPSLFLPTTRSTTTGTLGPSPYLPLLPDLLLPTATSLTTNPIKQFFFADTIPPFKKSSPPSFTHALSRFSLYGPAYQWLILQALPFADVLLTPSRLVQALAQFLALLKAHGNMREPGQSQQAKEGEVLRFLAHSFALAPRAFEADKSKWTELHPMPQSAIPGAPGFSSGQDVVNHGDKEREHYPIVEGEWSCVVMLESMMGRIEDDRSTRFNANMDRMVRGDRVWVGFVSKDGKGRTIVLGMDGWLTMVERKHPELFEAGMRERLEVWWEEQCGKIHEEREEYDGESRGRERSVMGLTRTIWEDFYEIWKEKGGE